MKKNLGPEDRIARIVIAIGIAVVIYFAVVDGTAAIVAELVAAYLIVTGLLARDPLYKLAGLDTSMEEQSYSTTDDRAGL
jgi:hypothetical protein